MHGIYPYYGPFGDINDVVACEDQFRNAFLLGCVGAWSLHPVQIDIANRVFSPERRGRRARAPRGRGDGRRHRRGDARRQDGGRRLAQAVPGDGRAGRAARPRSTPSSQAQYDAHDRGLTAIVTRLPPPPLGPLHARRPTSGPWRRPRRIPCDGADPRPRGRRRPRRQGRPPARPRAPRSQSGEYGRRELTIRVNGVGTEWHDDDLAAAARRRPGRDRRAQGRLAPTTVRAARRRDGGGRRARPHHALGDGRDAGRDAPRRGDRRAPPTG